MAENLGDTDMPSVNTVALALSVGLWGLYTYLCIIMVLALRRRGLWLASLPIYCTTLVFVCNFGDTFCVVFTACKGYFFYPGGKVVYFIRYNDRTIDRGWYAASSLFRGVTCIGANALLIWRAFVIWSRDKRTLYFPVVLLFFTTIACALVVVYNIQWAPRFLEDPAVLARYGYITVTLLAMDIINTWYCTGLICYRLCSLMRQKRATADALNDLQGDVTAEGLYRRIIQVLIQSGMLLSTMELAVLVCIASSNRDGTCIMTHMFSSITGITTVLMIIQMNILPLRNNMNNSLQRSASGSFTMPVFRKLVNYESTTNQVGAQGISQSTAYEDSMQQTISYLAAYGLQSNEQSSTNEDNIERATSYLAPYTEQSQNLSSSTVAVITRPDHALLRSL
ncbi:hypothetical protein FRB93_009164 [Tulasnella sp. JGI-2019a]|nr:hypothetical protein FRB93_009164 [Tulasnella sp. JGI-2019a]